jgi:hypothetical protein
LAYFPASQQQHFGKSFTSLQVSKNEERLAMGPLTFSMLVVFVVGIICIKITLKSTHEPAVSWECVTCGENNASGIFECSECGMERQD